VRARRSDPASGTSGQGPINRAPPLAALRDNLGLKADNANYDLSFS
jgi:hypothetical protein